MVEGQEQGHFEQASILLLSAVMKGSRVHVCVSPQSSMYFLMLCVDVCMFVCIGRALTYFLVYICVHVHVSVSPSGLAGVKG